jgi:hypothetical protein
MAVSLFGLAVVFGVGGAGSPRLLHVREPDLLGIERADSPLPFGSRLVQLTEPHCSVATDDDWTSPGLDHHYL